MAIKHMFFTLLSQRVRKSVSGFTLPFGNALRSWHRVISGTTLSWGVMPRGQPYPAVKGHGQRAGFTLIELIVTIAVFSIVVLASVDVMVSVFRAQAKAIALKDVLDNARFSLELISREIRTGTNIRFTTGTPPTGCPRNGLQFTSYNQGSPQERFYYWEDTDGDLVLDALMRVAMPVASTVDCNTVAPQQFTSEEIILDRWTIRLSGNAVGPADGQPRITFGFVMHSRNSQLGSNTVVRIQTTITPRPRDL